MRFLFCNSMRSEHLRTQLQGAPVSWLLNFIFLLTTCTCPKLRRSFAEYGLFCSSSSLIESPFIVKYHHSNINIFTIKKTQTHTLGIILYYSTAKPRHKTQNTWHYGCFTGSPTWQVKISAVVAHFSLVACELTVFFPCAQIFKLVRSHNRAAFSPVSNQDLKLLGLSHQMALKTKNHKFWNSRVLLLDPANWFVLILLT